MTWNSRTIRQFIIVCVLLGFGSTYLILDYCSLPNETQLMWEGEFKRDVDRSYGDPSMAFKIGLGDGFISNIEMIFTHMLLIIGCFESVEFALCFEPKRTVDVKAYFLKTVINKFRFRKSLEMKTEFRKIINRKRNKVNKGEIKDE